MKILLNRLTVFLLLAVLTLGQNVAQSLEEQNFIRIDQFGYTPDAFKFAVIAKAVNGYNAGFGIDLDATQEVELRDAGTDEVVFSALASIWNNGITDGHSGDKGWWFDFTSYETEGSYYVRAYKSGGGSVDSYEFDIDEYVYNDVMRVAMNVFYYQRVNQPKTAEYASGATWVDDEWYTQDRQAKFLNDESITRDISRGWIDAGDPNKYVTFATDVVNPLLTTYEQFPEFWRNFDLKIPESGDAVPDLIDEIKWELDWLKNMQDYPGTGGFYIKAGIKNNSAYVSPPSTDDRERFFDQLCASATIEGAGMLAHAANVLKEIPELRGYVDDLTARAEAAWRYHKNSPNKTERCDGGEIEAGDADGPGDHYPIEHVANAAASAVYLFELTGKEEYNEAVMAGFDRTRPWSVQGAEWGIYRSEQSEAILHYAHLPNADAATKQAILDFKTASTRSSGRAYSVVESHNIYRGRSLIDNWGTNSLISRLGSDNMDFIYYDLLPQNHENYREKGQGIVNYMHGTNPFGICYLTNMYQYGAEFATTEMWHTWFNTGSVFDNIDNGNVGPAPGYVVGGMNPRNSDGAIVKIGVDRFPSATRGSQPDQKAYTEDNNGNNQPWAFNEPAIYYQAGYVKMLAHFVETEEIAEQTVTVTATNGKVLESEEAYANGSTASFVAIADPGFMFNGWTGDVTSDENPLRLLVDGEKNIVANFVESGSDECRVVNASFEDDLLGWTDYGVAGISDDANNGDKAIEITEEGGIYSSSLVAVGDNNGLTLEASAKISGIISEAYVGVNFLDSEGEFMGREFLTNFGAEYETKSSLEAIPEGAEYLQAFAWRPGSAGSFVIDDFCFSLTDNFVLPDFQLTVSGGVGTGLYKEDSVVEIEAGEPAQYKRFAGWTGDTEFLTSTGASKTTLLMPDFPISITAQYEDEEYVVNVISGDGDGRYIFGETVTIEANVPDGKEFEEWTGSVEHIEDPKSEVTELTVPGETVILIANFTDIEDEVTSIEEVRKFISIAPNPIQGEVLSFESKNEKYSYARITSLLGKELYSFRVHQGKNSIDLSGRLSAGTYLIGFGSETETLGFQKLVVE